LRVGAVGIALNSASVAALVGWLGIQVQSAVAQRFEGTNTIYVHLIALNDMRNCKYLLLSIKTTF
jgi:hypothetical protein